MSGVGGSDKDIAPASCEGIPRDKASCCCCCCCCGCCDCCCGCGSDVGGGCCGCSCCEGALRLLNTCQQQSMLHLLCTGLTHHQRKV